MEHSKAYKNKSKDIDDLRRRRNEVTVELRKNKRDEALLKKRNIKDEPSSSLESFDETNFSDADMSSILLAAMNPDLEEKYRAIKYIRKLLSTDKNPPIDEVINAGILPILVDGLKYEQMPQLQFETAWALTNIASGSSEQTLKVVDSGAVPLFIKLLSSPSENVAEQSVWALGNIIGDGANLRDYAIANGLLQPLLMLFETKTSVTFLRNLTWTILNICRNKNPPPNINVIACILPVLEFLLQHSTDVPIVIDVVWTLSYITDHGSEQIQMVLDSSIVQYVVPMLINDETKIHTPALRVVGNIATGTDDQTQKVLDLNALTYIPKLLENSKDRIKKEALWFISNITAGRVDQIQMLIDLNIMPIVIDFLGVSNFSLQKEAAWAVSNMTLNGSAEQVKYLVNNNIIERICGLLICEDAQVIRILLEMIYKIFSHYKEDFSFIADEIEKHNGLDHLEALQNHPDQEIYKFAYEIIDKYFDCSDDVIPIQGEEEFQFQADQGEPTQQFQF